MSRQPPPPQGSGPAAGGAPRRLVVEEAAIDLGGRRLLGPISLDVPGGEVVTVLGPSGSGKSSLLAFLTGTLPPGLKAHGRVLVQDRDVTALPPEDRRIGILFQDDLLFPHLSVWENLAFGLPAGLSRRERNRRVATVLEEAELASVARRQPATLAAGQRARAALMRTLLAEPRALLLDEPFARLDAALRGRLRGFVFDHARARGLPILLVTHDPADAEAAGGPVLDLGGGGTAGPKLVTPAGRGGSPRGGRRETP